MVRYDWNTRGLPTGQLIGAETLSTPLLNHSALRMSRGTRSQSIERCWLGHGTALVRATVLAVAAGRVAAEERGSVSRPSTDHVVPTAGSDSKSLLFRHHGAPAGAELLIRNSSKFRAPTMRRRRPPCSIRSLRSLLDQRSWLRSLLDSEDMGAPRGDRSDPLLD